MWKRVWSVAGPFAPSRWPQVPSARRGDALAGDFLVFHDARDEVVATFEKALADVVPALRAAAADWFASEAQVQIDLGRSPPIPASTLPILRRLLSNPEPRVRWAAAATLWTVARKAEGLVPLLADQVRQRWDIRRPLARLDPIRQHHNAPARVLPARVLPPGQESTTQAGPSGRKRVGSLHGQDHHQPGNPDTRSPSRGAPDLRSDDE